MFAGAACLMVTIVVWQQSRTAAGTGSLIVLMLALSWWDITYAVFWIGAPGPTHFFWMDITYIGVVIIPAAFLVFALQLAQLEDWLKPPILLALTIEPVLVLVLMWTDPWHGLFFAGKRALNATLILDAGPVFWANVGYSYILVLITCILLVRVFLRSSGLYRRQAAMVLVAAGFPWLNSIMFVFGLNPLPNIDNTPFAVVAARTCVL